MTTDDKHVEFDGRCPQCKAEGETSILRDGGTSAWLMNVSTFYDEAGVYHFHDPNRRSTWFDCSRGHSFIVHSWPACRCGYQRGETTVEMRERVKHEATP